MTAKSPSSKPRHALQAGTCNGVVMEAGTSKDNAISREEAKLYAFQEGPVR